MAVRQAAEQLAALGDGQSPGRFAAERELRELEQGMQRALDCVTGKEFDSDTLDYVRGSRVGELALTRYGRPDEEKGVPPLTDGWWYGLWGEYTSDVAAVKSLLAKLNDERAVGHARAEVSQAMRTLNAAMRQSAGSLPPFPRSFRVDSSGALAAAPLLLFLVVAAVGMTLAPTGAAAWIVVTALVVATAGAIWGTLKRGVTTGILAGLGASGSLALFSAAYLACRALGAASVVREGSPAVPIKTISEASFAALTAGATGGTIGISLNGAARVFAFIQILLTISGVVAVLTRGWQVLLARTTTASGNQETD